MYYKVCNLNRNIKPNNIYIRLTFSYMNRSDLNIISCEMRDRICCALCGINNVFTELSDPNSKEGGIWRQLCRYHRRSHLVKSEKNHYEFYYFI